MGLFRNIGTYLAAAAAWSVVMPQVLHAVHHHRVERCANLKTCLKSTGKAARQGSCHRQRGSKCFTSAINQLLLALAARMRLQAQQQQPQSWH